MNVCEGLHVYSMVINLVAAQRTVYQGRSFCNTSFQLRTDLKVGQKQGRDERTPEGYPTFVKMHSKCRVVVLNSSLPYFSPFFSFILTGNKVLQKPFPLVSVLFRGFLSHLPNRKRSRLFGWRRTHFERGLTCFALGTNALVLETKALRTRVRTSAHPPLPPHTHTVTCDFQTELLSR